MVPQALDLEPLRCAYPGGCRAAPTRTLDTGAGVVAACPRHQQSPWWGECRRRADEALREARKAWGVRDDDERDGEGR